MHGPNGYSHTWVQVRVRAWGSASSVLRARVNVLTKLIVLKNIGQQLVIIRTTQDWCEKFPATVPEQSATATRSIF